MKLLRQHPHLPPTPRYGAAGNPLPEGEEATTRLARATLGSARASRADCGASPQSILRRRGMLQWVRRKKFAMAGAPSPPREARALPRMRGHACKLIIVCCISVSCELTNYVPPVTQQMAASNSRKQDLDLNKLREGRTLFVHRCIECHTLPPLWHYTSKDWTEIVNSMSHRASLKPAERDAVIAYILAVRATER